MSAVETLRHEGQQAAALAQRIREMCGDDHEAFTDTLDGETDAIEAARSVVRWIAELEANGEAMKALAKDYAARGSLLDERARSARTALLHFMTDLGAKKLPLPEATLSVVAGRPQLIGDVSPDELPDTLVRIKREPDRGAIKDTLLSGADVPGFSLSNGAPSLQIRKA